MYMSTIPLAEARANLSRIIDDAVRTHERVEVTRNGVRAAVVLSAGDYDSLTETLDILSDADAVRDLREAMAELAAGHALTTADVLSELPVGRRGGR